MDTLPDQTYEEVLAAHVQAYGPEDPVEHGLVARIARAAFRLAQAPALEERLVVHFELETKDCDPVEELKALDLLARYEARLQMAARRAQQELIVLRRIKGKELPAPLRPERRPERRPRPAKPKPKNGLVMTDPIIGADGKPWSGSEAYQRMLDRVPANAVNPPPTDPRLYRQWMLGTRPEIEPDWDALRARAAAAQAAEEAAAASSSSSCRRTPASAAPDEPLDLRSEERRVGKEC